MPATPPASSSSAATSSARGPSSRPIPRTGYALCLRSGKAYALLVFQRRVFEPGISQVADDAAILRRDAETAICRRRSDWTAA